MTVANNPVSLLMLESLCYELRLKLEARPKAPSQSEIAVRQLQKIACTTLQVLAVVASAYLTIVVI